MWNINTYKYLLKEKLSFAMLLFLVSAYTCMRCVCAFKHSSGDINITGIAFADFIISCTFQWFNNFALTLEGFQATKKYIIN